MAEKEKAEKAQASVKGVSFGDFHIFL